MAIVSVDERIVFVGLARVTDGALLASIFVDSKIASQEKQQFERQFLQSCQQQRGITNAEFKTRVILEYPCQGNMFVMAGNGVSSHCLYAIGIRDAGYPERLAYACLNEVLERVHVTQGDSLHHLSSLSLTKPLKKPVREIIKRYQLADRDKTFDAGKSRRVEGEHAGQCAENFRNTSQPGEFGAEDRQHEQAGGPVSEA
ncbi:unnamed protein product, partial [Amoebophrya sp. A120]|eukprot:GSA120T00013295001.1